MCGSPFAHLLYTLGLKWYIKKKKKNHFHRAPYQTYLDHLNITGSVPALSPILTQPQHIHVDFVVIKYSFLSIFIFIDYIIHIDLFFTILLMLYVCVMCDVSMSLRY